MNIKAVLSKKFLKRAFLGVLVLLGILIILGLLFPGGGPQRAGYHLISWYKMQGIAKVIQCFQKEHNGAIPTRLSELVPEYLPAEYLFFHSPYTTSVMPAEIKAHPELIDFFSPYFFAVLEDHRILVSERPGMWLDGSLSYFLMDVHMQPVGTPPSCRVTPDEFQRRLLSQFQQ